LLASIGSQQLVLRRLDMESGRSDVAARHGQDALDFDGKVLSAVYGPRWRLVLIGGGQLTRYLAEMAKMLDYHVTVVDPRAEYADGWDVAGVALERDMPDDVIARMNLDGHSAVVALTHDPKLDDMALLERSSRPRSTSARSARRRTTTHGASVCADSISRSRRSRGCADPWGSISGRRRRPRSRSQYSPR
jgi:xanthine dehydrogenase accessory factor